MVETSTTGIETCEQTYIHSSLTTAFTAAWKIAKPFASSSFVMVNGGMNRITCKISRPQSDIQESTGKHTHLIYACSENE